MAHTNTWDVTTPLDASFMGLGDDELRKIKLDLKERLGADHNMDCILDTSLPTADGYHSKCTMKVQASDPTLITGAGIVYVKSDGLYFRNSSGIVKVV